MKKIVLLIFILISISATTMFASDNMNKLIPVVKALKNKKIPVYYMLKENEGHGFHNQENQIKFYKYLEAFFGKFLRGNTLTNPKILNKIRQ